MSHIRSFDLVKPVGKKSEFCVLYFSVSTGDEALSNLDRVEEGHKLQQFQCVFRKLINRCVPRSQDSLVVLNGTGSRGQDLFRRPFA